MNEEERSKLDEQEDDELFQIDDSFDPLEDVDVAADDDDEDVPNDYQTPIPDADKSVVPDPVDLPAPERIAKLIKGIPGQQFRILAVVEACSDEEKTATQIEEDVDNRYSRRGSVYTTARLIELLEEAGGIVCTNPEVRGAADDENANDAANTPEPEQTSDAGPSEEPSEDAPTEQADGDDGMVSIDSLSVSSDDLGVRTESVVETEPELFLATDAGREAVAKYAGTKPAIDMLSEEDQYLPIYERIYHLIDNEKGCATKDLKSAVDSDPLVQKPRRFCTYFLDRLERCDAAQWDESDLTWKVTPIGKQAFETVLSQTKEDVDD